jgi:hypothetical protein
LGNKEEESSSHSDDNNQVELSSMEKRAILHHIVEKLDVSFLTKRGITFLLKEVSH